MLERKLDRVQDITLDIGESSNIVPSDTRNLGRSDALRVGAASLLERFVEVHRSESDSGVLQILQSSVWCKGEDTIRCSCTSTADEVDEIVGDESGSLNREGAEGDVGSHNGGCSEGTQNGQSLGLSRCL